ncbi:MAG: dehydrogenase [Paucimonas sp.]|nr:dehydrogenase [Paucimonas sp.]
MRHQHKTAIVTGSAQGIGLACATRLVQEGAQVMLTDVDATKGSQAAAALGPGASFQAADVSIRADVDALVEAAMQRFGRIDILVNNAGITHAADFLDLREEDFDRVLRVNLKSMFLCGQAVARQMVRQGSGAIINMSSVNAVVAIANQVPYVVSKGGVNQLTKVMALNLAPHGVRVNAVGPGTIMTELARQAVMGSAQARRNILSRTPAGRCGEPEEVAAVVSFLASDEGSYFCGQTLYPDGGRLALNYTVPVADSD